MQLLQPMLVVTEAVPELQNLLQAEVFLLIPMHGRAEPLLLQ